MKRSSKILLVIIGLVLISQIPFAYRRFKLDRLSATIQRLNSERIPSSNETSYTEYKGVFHVHSFLGGHSSGSFQEIIEAAKANGLQFVVMTEHPAKDFNTAATTLKGNYAGELFVNGNEVATREGDRLLIVPGDEISGTLGSYDAAALINRARSNNQLAAIAYPAEFKSPQTADAIEIYNVYTNARGINPLLAFFDTIWSYRSNHDLLFASFYSRPSDAIAKWDQATQTRKIVALAGNDAHANIGFSLEDSAGKNVLGLKLDPYETSFHLVRMHVLIPKEKRLDEASLIEAVKQGHCFIGFDLFAEAEGFNFVAFNGTEQRIQGDEITLLDEVRLIVTSPIPARILLFRNGQQIQEQLNATNKEFPVKEKGVYRVELYLPQLNDAVSAQPWIISNPIYVK